MKNLIAVLMLLPVLTFAGDAAPSSPAGPDGATGITGAPEGPEGPVVAPAQEPAPAAVPQLNPATWIKIGPAFGRRTAYQFGFDKAATAGACGTYAFKSHQFLFGPCRDIFILARDSAPMLHAGFMVGYGASRKANYMGRFGANIGPATSDALERAANYLPYLETLADWRAPAWMQYLGKISTVDYHAGNVDGAIDHGPALKIDVPLADLYALLPGGAE